MLREGDAPKLVEHQLWLVCRLYVFGKGCLQVLLEACCIAVDVRDEHVTDEALPSHRSSEQAVLGQRGAINICSESREACVMKRDQIIQLLPEIISDIIWRNFSHVGPCASSRNLAVGQGFEPWKDLHPC